jgi:O-antigen ligase
VLAWTALAFGGIYPATLFVPAIAILALGLAYRPVVLRGGPAPLLDRLLLLSLAAALIQLTPIPRTLLHWLSPAAETVARTMQLVDTGEALPLSINLQDSAAAALLYAAVLLFFFTARQIFDTGGVRTTIRGIAVMGLALSAVAIAQDATAHGMMYWRWRPLHEGPAPFGPFVNRNHFGTWAIMALPLCLGYLTAHAAAHPGPAAHASWRRKVVAALDGRAALLLLSAALLIVAVAASLSRSAIIGLMVALVVWGELARRHAPATVTRSVRPAVFMGALVTLALFAVAARVGPSILADRFGQANVALADRVTIWRDAVPVLRDFWLTGTGIGTYQSAMAVYQRSSPGVLFNQAHNHFLQLAAEGGVLVALPVLGALGAFVALGWRRLQADRSGVYWLRAGAAAGLCGVAVQSLWETGLTLPANAALAAVLAAIVLHVPARFGPPRAR